MFRSTSEIFRCEEVGIIPTFEQIRQQSCLVYFMMYFFL